MRQIESLAANWLSEWLALALSFRLGTRNHSVLYNFVSANYLP